MSALRLPLVGRRFLANGDAAPKPGAAGPAGGASQKGAAEAGKGIDFTQMQNNPQFRSARNMFLWSSLAFAGLYLASGNPERETTWKEFKEMMLDRDEVERLEVINRRFVRVHLKRGGLLSADRQYYFHIGSLEAFERRLEEAQHVRRTSNVLSYLTNCVGTRH